MIFIFVLLSRGEQHPQCAIRVVEAFSSTIPAMMQSAHVDVAIVTDTHPHVGLETNLLAQEEFFLVGRAGDAIVAASEMTLRDVGDLPLLLPGSSGGIRRVVEQVFAEQGVAMNVAGPWKVSVESLTRGKRWARHPPLPAQRSDSFALPGPSRRAGTAQIGLAEGAFRHEA